MIQLAAPFPTYQSKIALPDPDFSDVRALEVKINPRVSMSGVVRTYIQTSSQERLTYRFVLTREAALALREFFRLHYSHKIFMRTHDNESWLGTFLTNPFEFTAATRALRSGGYENITIELQFVGVKVA